VGFRISAFGLSHIGKVRPRNEDTLAVEPSKGLVVVADGMGGAPGGDVASATAVQEVCRGIHAGAGLREAILEAHARIVDMARSRPALQGMGTTLTALHLDTASGDFSVGHVGDSRAFRFHRGELVQITRDHTAVAEMVEKGTIRPEAARTHPLSHVLSRVVGCEPEPEVDILLGTAQAGDLFLLCSDGLEKVFRNEELAERVARGREAGPEALVQSLVEEANARGGPDNVTVAVLLVDGESIDEKV